VSDSTIPDRAADQPRTEPNSHPSQPQARKAGGAASNPVDASGRDTSTEPSDTAAGCIDGHAPSQYRENVPRGARQDIPTVDVARTPLTTARAGRAVAGAELTLQVSYVSGPESASLARTQYQAIREVLQWLHTHPPDPTARPAP
jgi:hypothetical protein